MGGCAHPRLLSFSPAVWPVFPKSHLAISMQGRGAGGGAAGRRLWAAQPAGRACGENHLRVIKVGNAQHVWARLAVYEYTYMCACVCVCEYWVVSSEAQYL